MFVGVVVGIVGEVAVVLPADAGAEFVESGDRSFGLWSGVVVVLVGVAVVGRAFEAAVELRGRPAAGVGDDVVDVAPIGGFVAA